MDWKLNYSNNCHAHIIKSMVFANSKGRGTIRTFSNSDHAIQIMLIQTTGDSDHDALRSRTTTDSDFADFKDLTLCRSFRENVSF